MRKNRENQLPLSPSWPDHRLARELESISKILDQNPSISDLVLHDLCDKVSSKNGARGMTAEQVLRCALIKQTHQFSYEKLAFHLKTRRVFAPSAGSPMGSPPANPPCRRTSRALKPPLGRPSIGCCSIGLIRKVWRKGVRFEWMPPESKATSAIRSIAICFTIRFGS